MAQAQLDDPTDWKREDLMQAFHRLSELDTKSAHLCLFIDGLDEYQGDHQDLIETIQHLSRLKIKICVASRPWNIFRETFGQMPQLRMQELNTPDIEVYVRDRLFLRHDFQRARVATNDMDLIMSEITEKSQGVFLWVYLVVRSLIEGLRNRDPVSLLMKRLSSYPSDLNEFFYDMFSSLDPIYHNKTAKMFLLTLETMSSLYAEIVGPIRLTTLTHWYLDELEEHPNLPFGSHTADVDEDTIIHYSTTASLRINGRCKGLLEVIPGPERRQFRTQAVQQGEPDSHYWYEVTFLHRTVADFFETPDIQKMLKEWLVDDLSSLSLVGRAILAEIEAIIKVTGNPWPEIMEPAITRFLSIVCLQEKSRDSTLAPLLDELSKVLFNQRLCEPLSFARMIAEYDLLIYVGISPSTQEWVQQPASKVAVLDGTGDALLTYQLTDRKRNLTGAMICLIHSMGPPVVIGSNAQDLLETGRNQTTSDEEFIGFIRQLTRTAYFELATAPSPDLGFKAFANDILNRQLVEIIGHEQLQRLAESCLRKSSEKDQEGDRRFDSQDSEKRKQKQKKKNLFRKLFRSG